MRDTSALSSRPMRTGTTTADGRRGADGPRPALSIGIVVLPRFTLVAFASFVDTLRLAADEGDRSRPHGCRWTIIGAQRRPVHASCGAELVPWAGYDTAETFDYVAVAGGLLPPRDRPLLDHATRGFLRAMQARGARLIGLCTGSLALAEAGFIAPGGRCCVSWYHHDDLRERVPEVEAVSDRLWIEDGRIITCAGGIAAADLAAALVKRHLSQAAAEKSLHIMLVDTPRPARTAQPLPPKLSDAADQRVRRVVLVMEQNMSHPPPVEHLARVAAVSRRQLERLFRAAFGRGVQQFGRDLRLQYAVWLLAGGRAPVSEVAARCGFGDAAHFSRVFRAAFGRPPSGVRAMSAPAVRRMLETHRPGAGQEAAALAPQADRRPYG